MSVRHDGQRVSTYICLHMQLTMCLSGLASCMFVAAAVQGDDNGEVPYRWCSTELSML